MAPNATLRDAAKLVTHEFVIMWPDELFNPIDAAYETLRESASLLAKEFRANLHSALLVACIPYTMASNSVIDRMSQAHLASARIRRLPLSGEDLSDEDERAAAVAAHNELQEFMNSDEGEYLYARCDS